MKIQDLLIETQLEEGPGWDQAKAGLKGIAQGAGNVARGAVKGIPGAIGSVAKGAGAAVGGVQGAYRGAKQAFAQGQQQAAQSAQQAVLGQPVPQQQAQTQQQIEPTMEPANTTAVNPGVPTSDETSAQANQTNTNPAAAGSRIGAPAGKQAVDNALKTVSAVRSDRRQGVIDYAQDKLAQAEQELAAMRKNAGIQQQPNLQVQQGGKAPVQQAAA